ncbi:hypothetical protein I302_102661 [Kwoniella bestiolae CBS 10118]|uniref:Uncharacterized protein n=1 Tax=Kwoniella bestiolae CBS 10118 TaxID=1296100 RepID=A0A1B9GFM1_9TREE|nr:hypothetical protein I302_01355 [Kwoniella bestiolae CBS 10118]OCF29842.1 hypothetical protein I302_01355 [Kwoniella bestiolae CBS 10118]
MSLNPQPEDMTIDQTRSRSPEYCRFEADGNIASLASTLNIQENQRVIILRFRTDLDDVRAVKIVVPFSNDIDYPDLTTWVSWAMNHGVEHPADAVDGHLQRGSMVGFIETAFPDKCEKWRTGLQENAAGWLGDMYNSVVARGDHLEWP